MDAASTPTSTSKPTAVGASAASEVAQLIELRTAAIVEIAAGILGRVHQAAEGVEELVAAAVLCRRGSGQQLPELDDADGFVEDVQGALPQHEAVGAHGELGHEAFVELVFADAEQTADLAARVAGFDVEVVFGQLRKLLELGAEFGDGGLGVVGYALFLFEVGVVEATEADSEGRGVGWKGTFQVEDFGEEYGGESALDYAEVIADRRRNMFICCNKTLCDDECEFRGGIWKAYWRCRECRFEGDIEGIASQREYRSRLIHAVILP